MQELIHIAMLILHNVMILLGNAKLHLLAIHMPMLNMPLLHNPIIVLALIWFSFQMLLSVMTEMAMSSSHK